jgi:hypothetical protein
MLLPQSTRRRVCRFPLPNTSSAADAVAAPEELVDG